MKGRRVIKVSPSIIASKNYKNDESLTETLAKIEKAGANFVHLDVMDGKFVSNTTFDHTFVEKVAQKTNLILDVHLMVENPDSEIDRYVKAGADIISVHYEACKDLVSTLRKIKSRNVIAGVVINPETSVLKIKDIIEARIADLVLVMSVKPGASGQPFQPVAYEKIIEIREYSKKILIEVDGGVCPKNAGQLTKYGANILVSGSCVFNSPDMKKTIDQLKGKTFANKLKSFFNK